MKCLDIDAADIERMIANIETPGATSQDRDEARRKAARAKQDQMPEWERAAKLERRREQFRRSKRKAREHI